MSQDNASYMYFEISRTESNWATIVFDLRTKPCSSAAQKRTYMITRRFLQFRTSLDRARASILFVSQAMLTLFNLATLAEWPRDIACRAREKESAAIKTHTCFILFVMVTTCNTSIVYRVAFTFAASYFQRERGRGKSKGERNI